MLRHIAVLAGALLAGGASATTLTGAVNMDDRFAAYLSTDDAQVGTQIGSGWGWEVTFGFSAQLDPGKAYYLHVFGEDVGGMISGFLGAFSLSDTGYSFVNGTQSLLTNSSDWKVSATGFGTNYVAPVSQGDNGVWPWGTRQGVPSEADWIWTGPRGTLKNAYFSTAIVANVSPVPEPMAAVLLASGLGVLALRRKKLVKVA